MFVNHTRSALFSILLFTLSVPLHAGEIVGFTWSSGVASVAGATIVPPIIPNNDDVVGPSPNPLFVTQKDYVAIGPVDLVFTVNPTGGVTEYQVDEGVQNSTGIDWNSYRIELGFGEGAGFVQSPPGDGLDFDAPDYNSGVSFAPFFTTVVENEDVLLATGGVFPNGAFTTPLFQFTIDVPDLPPGVTTFTIRQQPIGVPEPTSVVLVCLITLTMVTLRRRGSSAK